MSATNVSANKPPERLDEVRGWFPQADQLLFTWFLDRQRRREEPGDVLELGAYVGKSAILIGRHVREDEKFTVCDLFESTAPDQANQSEMRRSYANLTREAFEDNYLAFHERLPEIVQGPSSVILDHVKSDSCRFVHIDASHVYEHVRGDIEAARTVLRSGGLVVCDDYRSQHTPGVALAVWEAVSSGLRPICVSTQKLYGTWGDPAPVQEELRNWLRGRPGLWHEVQQVAGRPLIRVKARSSGGGSEMDRLKAALRREKDAHARTRRELADVRGSLSFRIGRALTALPRTLRDTAPTRRS